MVAIDQTTLDAVMRHLPELRKLKNGDPVLLPGRLSGRFDLRRQQWQKIEFTDDAQQNEKVLARRMVEGLAQGSLVLFDLASRNQRGYAVCPLRIAAPSHILPTNNARKTTA